MKKKQGDNVATGKSSAMLSLCFQCMLLNTCRKRNYYTNVTLHWFSLTINQQGKRPSVKTIYMKWFSLQTDNVSTA